MAGSGRVSSVWKGTTPKDNKPATGILTDVKVPCPGGVGEQGIEFYIEVPAGARIPEVGDYLRWDAHHALIGPAEPNSYTKYRKLTWELDPNRKYF